MEMISLIKCVVRIRISIQCDLDNSNFTKESFTQRKSIHYKWLSLHISHLSYETILLIWILLISYFWYLSFLSIIFTLDTFFWRIWTKHFISNHGIYLKVQVHVVIDTPRFIWIFSRWISLFSWIRSTRYTRESNVFINFSTFEINWSQIWYSIINEKLTSESKDIVSSILDPWHRSYVNDWNQNLTEIFIATRLRTSSDIERERFRMTRVVYLLWSRYADQYLLLNWKLSSDQFMNFFSYETTTFLDTR